MDETTEKAAGERLGDGDAVEIDPRSARRMRVDPDGTVVGEVYEISGELFVKVRTRDCAGMLRRRTVGVNVRNVHKL